MSTTILVGHVLDKLKDMPDDSVHMVITSPPYWGLRAYGTEHQVWGGDPDCDHEWGEERIKGGPPARQGYTSQREGRRSANENVKAAHASTGTFCQKCGAWRGEHGQEPTLAMWLENEVLIFREVRRVLRPDGTLWLNCGDAYASTPNGRSAADTKTAGTDNRTFRDRPINTALELRPKNRLMLPARLALALQDDGWWLRDEIVWHKKNPMPSSIKDRTCPAHEMMYMFSKRPRYFYDATAISEPIADSSVARYAQPTINEQRGGTKQDAYETGFTGSRARSRRPNEIIQDLAGQGQKSRLKRSVWTFALEPFAEAHFATFPPALVRPCVLAGTSAKGVCPECGAPWERMSQRTFVPQEDAPNSAGRKAGQTAPETRWEGSTRGHVDVVDMGWRQTCGCPDHEPVPATVLDPFGGSGTTAVVADQFGRNCTLIELNPEYAKLARKRIRESCGRVASEMEEDRPDDLPLFATNEAAQ